MDGTQKYKSSAKEYLRFIATRNAVGCDSEMSEAQIAEECNLQAGELATIAERYSIPEMEAMELWLSAGREARIMNVTEETFRVYAKRR
ncbi:hypothetical protein C4552_02990 [Candidatus Parcubacteria bacterium]|nr:MAG: hypothetical protein C4552_02990 [Candidatus Parcubacteria bacterium]